MTTQDRLVEAKLSILKLAEELNNISKACRRAGIARSSFYQIKKAYEQFGKDGLYPQPKRGPKMPNAFAQETVEKILDMTRRFHQTLKNEFFAKAFREKFYTSLEELQIDLDAFLAFYNQQRSHSGYRCKGRTPMETFKELLANKPEGLPEAA